MQPGTLVRPSKQSIYLTPIDSEGVEDIENWIEWDEKQCGIVLPLDDQKAWILVFTPNGIGYCFLDEIKEIY